MNVLIAAIFDEFVHIMLSIFSFIKIIQVTRHKSSWMHITMLV